MLDQETSQLRRTIPSKIEKLLAERGITSDDVIIATDTDLSIAGEYSERWIIVTQKHVLVFIIEEDTALLVREVPIERIEKARTDSRVGSGFLEAKTDEDVYEELLRFSNRNADKFAKVAATIKLLAGGRPVDLTSEEEEKTQIGRCQKCGVRLADRSMSICHKCLKRGFVFMRFLARTKDYWPLTSMAMVLVILSILLSLFPQQLVKILIDNVFSKNDDVPIWFGALVNVFHLGSDHYKWLYIIVGALALTTLLAVIIIWLRERIAVTIANRLAFELRRDVFEKLENQEVEYHDDHPVGQLMTRCTQDVEALQGFINQLTSGFGYQILSLIGVAGIMFYMNWQLALIACLPAPLVMVCTVIFYKWVVPQWHKYWSTRSNLSNILHASLSGVRVVKAFAQEAREASRFEGFNAKFRDAGLSVGYASAWFYQMMGFVFQLGSYFVWLYGGHTILNMMSPDAASVTHELTVGGLMAFLGYLGMFYAPLNSLTQMSNWFTQFTTQAHRVFEVLDREEMIKEPVDAIALDIQGEIAFKNVTFGYDPHIPVLHEVSFAIKKGEMIGVVGHSGCGKSTTVSLIMRFYDPDEGSITIDNIDITRIKKKVLRRQIGMVAQDPFLFRGTIAENICYGNPDVSREVILDSSDRDCPAANVRAWRSRGRCCTIRVC
ncbi:MAG: ABC transporter ATP-binding protein [Candidatus Hydrogenedentes bacterium]|nr:ABC transporter ATP-binding protein [Candidatus Hydrogenedentota bacterium]